MYAFYLLTQNSNIGLSKLQIFGKVDRIKMELKLSLGFEEYQQKSNPQAAFSLQILLLIIFGIICQQNKHNIKNKNC